MDWEAAWQTLTVTHTYAEHLLQTHITNNYAFIDLPKAKYFISLCALYPLALLWRALPHNPTLKHIFNLTIGLWLAILVSGKGILINLGSAVSVYFIMLVFPSNIGRWLGLILSFALSSFGHVYRLKYSYMAFTLDFALIQMLMTLKLVMYCFDIHDGRRPVHQISNYRHAKTTALVETPSLLAYLGYMFFFPSLLVGPMHPFKRYRDFINMDMFGNLKRVPRGATRQGLLRLSAALVWLPVYIISFFYNIDFCMTEEFMLWSFPARAAYMIAVSFMFRPMYYYVWLAVEGALIIMGYGYNGHDPVTNKYRWDGASNIRVLPFELAQNPLELPAVWNIAVGRWLKYYFYTRLLNAGYKRLANPITFMVSALWHGFYPGYYFLFAFGPIFAWANSLARQKLTPRIAGTALEGLHNLLALATTWLISTYLIASFLTLNWENTIKVYRSVNFFGHAAVAIFIICLLIMPSYRYRSQESGPSTEDHHHNHRVNKSKQKTT